MATYSVIPESANKLAYKFTNKSTNVYTDRLWKLIECNQSSPTLEINGTSGLIVNNNTGEILFDKNRDTPRPIASLTKIMTAIIALEHTSLEENVVIDKESANIGENVMGISEGEQYSVEELLYGLLMNSGNDSAYAIAKHTAGSVPNFVEWMNFKAAELNLRNTHYADPSGLNDGNYSTPEDLVKLTRYAMQNPKFREMVGTIETELIGDNHTYLFLQNQTNLLTTYPGVIGVKTGYTEAAGLCLITYAENEGQPLIGVVLNSMDRKGDMILMLDYAYKQLGIVIEHHLLDPAPLEVPAPSGIDVLSSGDDMLNVINGDSGDSSVSNL